MQIDFEFVRECEAVLHATSQLERCKDSPPIALWVSAEATYRGGSLDGGTDTLGRYEFEPRQNIITLYEGSIRKYAGSAGLAVKSVTGVVLIHEIAHSVTHLGRLDGKVWKEFGRSGRVEHFAQLATWLFLQLKNKPDERRAFERMSDDSPARYQSWKPICEAHEWNFRRVRTKYRTTLIQESGREVRKSDVLDPDFIE